MKMKNIKVLLVIVLMAGFNSGCQEVLEEHPQSQIVPALFNTPIGVLGGIAGVYNDLRGFWGTEGFTNEMQAGTDEFILGVNGSGPVFTYNGLNSSNFGSAWGNAFQDINTLNGVLQYCQTIDLPAQTRKQYLAQAKFLRAFWYFYLVQTWGDVPLQTEFITVAKQSASRQPAADVYKLIIQDLTDAAADLPNTPTAPFLGKAATKPVAQYLLAKVYLTRGWLTNNQADFVQAASICDDIIANKGSYGLDLWADYGDAFVPANDYGKETMFVSDHMMDAKYGYYTVGGAAGGGAAQNLSPWLTNANYNNAAAGLNGEDIGGVLVQPSDNTPSPVAMQRDSYYGRSYVRMRPNSYIWPSGVNAGKNYFLDQAFTNRSIDSRYMNSFYTTYISNIAVTNLATAAHNKRGIPTYTTVVGQDTAIWFTDFDVAGAPQKVGTRPFKGIVMPPRLWNSSLFPSLKKFMDPSRGSNFNDPSTRPCVLYRFSDVFLIGAEAHFKAGNSSKAVDLINVIRTRAAYKKSNTSAQNVAAVAAMIATTGTDLATNGIDYILDERSRELFGEWTRWHDLVRTRTLVTRVKAWNPDATNYILPKHLLRPIPQSQIDRTTEGDKFPQNPNY